MRSKPKSGSEPLIFIWLFVCSCFLLHSVDVHKTCARQVIMNNRRLQYEERASASPLDYDNWFDYLRLEESAGDLDRTREASRVPG